MEILAVGQTVVITRQYGDRAGFLKGKWTIKTMNVWTWTAWLEQPIENGKLKGCYQSLSNIQLADK